VTPSASSRSSRFGAEQKAAARLSGKLSGPPIEDFSELLRLYGARNERKHRDLLAMADPLIDWTSNSRYYMPLASSDLTGTRALEAYLDELDRLLEPYRLEMLHSVCAEDTLALRGTVMLSARETGRSGTVDWFQALTMRRG
jgi:hypothetical protein